MLPSLVLVTSCSRSLPGVTDAGARDDAAAEVPIDARTDKGASDAPGAETGSGGAGVDASTFSMVAGPLDLSFCLCHHGCGPGVDGMLALHTNNATDKAVKLVLTALSVEEAIGGATYMAQRPQFLGASPADASFEATVAAGANQTLDVRIYADVDRALAGKSVHANVDLTVDGIATSVSSAPVTATCTAMAGGCGCP